MSKHNENFPVVAIRPFKNISKEDIDTKIVSDKMAEAMSGHFIVVGLVKPVEQTTRETESGADETNKPEKQNELPVLTEADADLILTGEVRSMIKQEGNKFSRTYYVKAILIKNSIDRVIWEGDLTLIKRVKGKGIVL